MDHNGKELALLISEKYKELYPKGGALYFYSEGEKADISAILRNIYDNAVTNGVKAAYFSAPDFCERYVSSLVSNDKNWYEHTRKELELLIIDDLHVISGKEATLEELTMIMKHIIDEQQGHVILGSHVLMNKLYGAPKELIALIEGHSFSVSLT